MKNILVVDNDRVFLLLISRLLEREGHRVVTANGGLEAIDILKTEVPDLILVDLIMPHIDGKTLCGMIREMEGTKTTPIVIVSATAIENREEIIRLGANACIVKTTLKQTAEHILSVINAPDLSVFTRQDGKFIGEDRDRPKSITCELLSLKKHFESVFDKMSEGVLEITPEGRVLYANTAAVAMCGATGKGLLGNFFLEGFSGENLRKIASLMGDRQPKHAKDNGKATLHLQGRWIEVNSLNVDENDDPTIVLILHDITHRVKAEEDLRSLNEKLVKEIEDRIRLQGRLARFESLAATGRLAASVAHEINSPLQAVSAMLTTMADAHSEDEVLTGQIDLLHSAYASIRDTVKNLLDLSRPQSQTKQPLDINRIVEKSADLSKSLLRKSGIVLELSLSPDVPEIMASPQQIGLLLLNLINNAAEAVHPLDQPETIVTGGDSDEPKIWIATFVKNNSIEIEVADNGSGIPDGDQRRIFDPFYTRKKKLGIGVGLANCLRIVENHGGKIRAANCAEGGALFTVTLPVDQKNTQQKEGPNEIISIAAGG